MKKNISKLPKRQKSEGKKNKYRVRNWKEYNQALVDRGRITFWISEEAIEAWENNEKTGKRGKPQKFSNIAIETALTLQQVFHLPLRQTEGLLASILATMGVTCKAPDYSTLSIRSVTLPISIQIRSSREEPLHVVIDSSGAKVYGEGEWKVRQHGWSKRRIWKKLHIGIDEQTGDILVGEVTPNNRADCEILQPLLAQLPDNVVIAQVSADGAYDKRTCYEALNKHKVKRIAIPPQHNARIWQHGNYTNMTHPRDDNLRRIRVVGRKQWKVETGYHRRSLAETGIFRLKTIFGERISARRNASQRTQLLIRCRALNRMTILGMPKSYLVA